jgi:hypothetical protein
MSSSLFRAYPQTKDPQFRPCGLLVKGVNGRCRMTCSGSSCAGPTRRTARRQQDRSFWQPRKASVIVILSQCERNHLR